MTPVCSLATSIRRSALALVVADVITPTATTAMNVALLMESSPRFLIDLDPKGGHEPRRTPAAAPRHVRVDGRLLRTGLTRGHDVPERRPSRIRDNIAASLSRARSEGFRKVPILDWRE